MGSSNLYEILGLTPWANAQEIRAAYRDLSKLYHPDITKLPPEVALEKCKELNQAYAVLSNPERRRLYDQSIQFSRTYSIKAPPPTQPLSYDNGLPNERPLSAGEIFALFIIFGSLVLCLGLAIAVSIWRGDLVSLAGDDIGHPLPHIGGVIGNAFKVVNC